MVNYRRVMRSEPQIYRNINRRRAAGTASTGPKRADPGISDQTRANTVETDERPENQGWTYEKIKAAYHATPHTISQIAKRFVTGGVEAALGRKEQANRHKKIDGRVEAHIIAIACSQAPEGRERWTLQLIADELVRLGVVGSISDTAVMETLKKTNLSPGKRRNGAFQSPGRSL